MSREAAGLLEKAGRVVQMRGAMFEKPSSLARGGH
jgi:hypothetical protein